MIRDPTSPACSSLVVLTSLSTRISSLTVTTLPTAGLRTVREDRMPVPSGSCRWARSWSTSASRPVISGCCRMPVCRVMIRAGLVRQVSGLGWALLIVRPICHCDCCGASGSAGAIGGGADAGRPGGPRSPDCGCRRRRAADDLVREMIEVLTSMWARVYGRPVRVTAALRAVTATKQPEPAGAAG